MSLSLGDASVTSAECRLCLLVLFAALLRHAHLRLHVAVVKV